MWDHKQNKHGASKIIDTFATYQRPPRFAYHGLEDQQAGRLRPTWLRHHAQLAEASNPAAAVLDQAPLLVYWHDGSHVHHPRLATQRLRLSENQAAGENSEALLRRRACHQRILCA